MEELKLLDSKSIFDNSLSYAKEHNVEIAVLAEALDLKPWEFMALAASEAGPSWEQLGKICATLGVDFSQLMNESSSSVKTEKVVVEEYLKTMPKLEGTETLREELINKLYGGVLGKVIGNRAGIPINNKTSTEVLTNYPHINGYLWDSEGKFIHPDAVLNGFFTFAEVLDKANTLDEITMESLQEIILDRVSYYHGFYWWDDNNSESVGFKSLLNGISPTKKEFHSKFDDYSTSGQAFYEFLGLVSLGDVGLAVELTKRLVPVSCLGEALNASIFVNACVSLAFYTEDPAVIVEGALVELPEGKVADAIREIVEFYKVNPYDWRDCLSLVEGRHKISKSWDFASIVATAVLYGRGNFNRSLEICMQFGTATSCTVSNVCTILGVLNGAKGINESTWIKPLRDTVLLSTTIGSTNSVSISDFTCKLAYNTAKLHNLALPEEYYCYANEALHRFTLKGGTYGAFNYKVDPNDNCSVKHFDGEGCSVVDISEITNNEDSKGRVFKYCKKLAIPNLAYCICFPTYFMRDWIDNYSYEPTNSPRVYPGQTVSMRFYTSDNDCGIKVKLVVIDQKGRTLGESEVRRLKENKWVVVEVVIPKSDQIVAGIIVATSIDSKSQYSEVLEFNGFAYYIDAIKVSGSPCYSLTSRTLLDTNGAIPVNSTNNLVGVYNHIEQITCYAGSLGVSQGSIVLEANKEYEYSSPEGFGMITFGPTLREYRVSMIIMPQQGAYHMMLFGVKGAKTMYAFGFYGKNTVKLLKVEKTPGDFVPLQSTMNTQFNWALGEQYELGVKFSNGELELTINREICFRQAVVDVNNFTGCFGFANAGDSESLISTISIMAPNSKKINVDDYGREREFLALDNSKSESSVEFIDDLEPEFDKSLSPKVIDVEPIFDESNEKYEDESNRSIDEVLINDEEEDANNEISVESVNDENDEDADSTFNRDKDGFIDWYSEGESGIFINDED